VALFSKPGSWPSEWRIGMGNRYTQKKNRSADRDSRRMIRGITCLAIAGAAVLASLALPPGVEARNASQPNPHGVKGHWKLTFDSEFGGSKVDANQWYLSCPWGGSQGRCRSGDGSVSCFDARDVAVGGGHLTMTVKRTSVKCVGRKLAYDGAFLSTDVWGLPTHLSWKYGFAEARIQYPNAAPLHGLWGGFWAAPTSERFPPELDISEWQSNHPRAIGTFFHWRCNPGVNVCGVCKPKCQFQQYTNLRSPGWHVYGAYWRQGRITWYIDGRAVGTATYRVADIPLDLRLTFEVNGRPANPVRSSTPLPQRMLVDYVRVWQ